MLDVIVFLLFLPGCPADPAKIRRERDGNYCAPCTVGLLSTVSQKEPVGALVWDIPPVRVKAMSLLSVDS